MGVPNVRASASSVPVPKTLPALVSAAHCWHGGGHGKTMDVHITESHTCLHSKGKQRAGCGATGHIAMEACTHRGLSLTGSINDRDTHQLEKRLHLFRLFPGCAYSALLLPVGATNIT